MGPQVLTGRRAPIFYDESGISSRAPDCDWIHVIAQGVPPHIGTPTPGLGYEDGDPYGAFLPPPLETDAEGTHEFMRAVVFVTEETTKGTERSPQEYADPLLVLTGEQYATLSFGALHRRLCDTLQTEEPSGT
jgi:hypothetical protein